jgi:glycosyltransferase involved in cell wall biosynthesis
VTEQRHIVIITPGFPKDESDDNCIPPLQDYAKLLSSKKYIIVSVITLQYPSTKSNYNWHNVNVYALGGNDTEFPKRLFIWKEAINHFKKINAVNSVDVIHSFWLSECALIGNYISSQYGLKHINTVMGKEANRFNRYLRFINFDKLKLAALSERQADSIKNASKRNADKIIPWGLDENTLPSFENYERKIDILGVGSLIPIKNFSSFINIIHKLKEFNPDIRSVIIGDGPLKEKLEHQIKKTGLENNVTLAGNLPREKVFEYMMQSKILLHTSTSESFGMVFIEALYFGLYIVSKPVGIAKSSERWIVCNSDDDFVTAVKHLLQSSQNYKQLLLHSLEKTVDSYLKIYFPQ